MLRTDASKSSLCAAGIVKAGLGGTLRATAKGRADTEQKRNPAGPVRGGSRRGRHLGPPAGRNIDDDAAPP